MTYSTAEDVRLYTGVQPTDLGLADVEDLDELLDKWLVEIKSIIDLDRRRDFLVEADNDPESVPPLVHNVAKRMASNTVALAVLRRDSPIIQINDFSVQLVQDRVLTADIRRDLALIPRGRTVSNPFRVRRMRNAKELAELEEADE